MTEAFFIQQDRNRFTSTDHTRGPWSPDAQHAGPPSALIGHCIEATGDRDDMQVVRITYEILQPVPVETLTIETKIARPGKRVEMIDATLSASDREIVRARAWRIRATNLDLEPLDPKVDVPPGPDAGRTTESFTDTGYLNAMET